MLSSPCQCFHEIPAPSARALQRSWVLEEVRSQRVARGLSPGCIPGLQRCPAHLEPQNLPPHHHCLPLLSPAPCSQPPCCRAKRFQCHWKSHWSCSSFPSSSITHLLRPPGSLLTHTRGRFGAAGTSGASLLFSPAQDHQLLREVRQIHLKT